MSSFNKNGFEAKFKTSEEKALDEKAKKISQEIKDNKQPDTIQSYIRFQNIESKILKLQEKNIIVK